MIFFTWQSSVFHSLCWRQSWARGCSDRKLAADKVRVTFIKNYDSSAYCYYYTNLVTGKLALPCLPFYFLGEHPKFSVSLWVSYPSLCL